ncbi:TetR/AcrR family transcriptional regulator [Paeniglutamicibacter sp.]|uniref:TetR/AcrR family transcriptional regulator n=1 Tax=Paeniglutamicibacter sp. TaxID=1934391 RepID=UPI0039899F50
MRIPANERKEQLIDATIALMQTRGVVALTLRDIAKHAGASLAAVHYCFDDKDELFTAAVERWLKNMMTYAEDVDPSFGLRSTVNEVARRYWDELEATPSDVLAQIELVVWAARQEGGQELAASIYPGYESGLGALFGKAMETDTHDRLLPPEELARIFIAIIDGCSLQYITQPNLTSHRRLFEFLVEAVLQQVAVPVRT